jgi:hypothetical protein
MEGKKWGDLKERPRKKLVRETRAELEAYDSRFLAYPEDSDSDSDSDASEHEGDDEEEGAGGEGSQGEEEGEEGLDMEDGEGEEGIDGEEGLDGEGLSPEYETREQSPEFGSGAGYHGDY